MIELKNISKGYPSGLLFQGVDFTIETGRCVGVIGENGCGKSVLLKIICGFTKPDSGEVVIDGEKLGEKRDFIPNAGVIINSPEFLQSYTGYENLALLAAIRKKIGKQEILKVLDRMGLSAAAKKKVKHYSMGMKQRLGIALALVGDPDLVILDEPINGLDPQGIAEVRETLYRLNQEKNITLIISSHILEELSKIATHYGIIHDGVLLQELTREELLAKCSQRIELKTNDTRKACTVLEGMGITDYKVVDVSTIHIFDRLTDSGEITMKLAENQVKTMGITVKNEALEDYYLNLTGGAANA